MKRLIVILEYRKLDNFRYSALGFGEFCEIPQRVTVKQQASGLLLNARGGKPLWKISALALILFLIFLSSCSKREFGEKLVINKFTPVLQLKKYPDNYLNKFVKVKGKVVEESNFRLWITLQDEHIIIMVNLNKLKGIPGILNKNIIVIGQFVKTKDGFCMNARWLKIL